MSKIFCSSKVPVIFVFLLILGFITGMVYWGEKIKEKKVISFSRSEEYIFERGVCNKIPFNGSQILNFEGMDRNSNRCKEILGDRDLECNGLFNPEDYRCIQVMIDHPIFNFTIHLEECFISVDMERILRDKELKDSESFLIIVIMVSALLCLLVLFSLGVYKINKDADKLKDKLEELRKQRENNEEL